MDQISIEQSCSALTRLHERFTNAEAIARKTLDWIEAEVRKARVSGFQVVARFSDELFFTFAGYGCYFRFVYTADVHSVEYGLWATARDESRVYGAFGEWQIGKDTVAEVERPEDLRPLFYAAVTRTLEWGGGRVRRYRNARQDLREFLESTDLAELETRP